MWGQSLFDKVRKQLELTMYDKRARNQGQIQTEKLKSSGRKSEHHPVDAVETSDHVTNLTCAKVVVLVS